ncbi:hypothetical protein [Streptosporangium sp. NPDC049644]|uniref:DUF7379 domain-containing protein n=1 Tax=Streptosporangium sp. NPDC049644 TaxID=3155507 RepID=UPI00342210E6
MEELRFPKAINSKGQIAGDGWVRDPDGSVLKLAAFKNQYIEVGSLNNSGSVVGLVDTDPDPFVLELRAFRTKPGKPIDLEKDILSSVNTTGAFDINRKGEVAGYGKDVLGGGGHVPLIWDEDGTRHEMTTAFGGRALAINNAGVAVGELNTRSGPTRAALYADGTGVDLNTLVPAGTALTLEKATGINDLNQITGVAKDSIGVRHAFLLDLGVSKPVVDSVTLETKRYPSEEWGVAEAVTEGDPARVTVSVTNPDSRPVDARIELSQAPKPEDAVPGTPLPMEPIELELAPNETVNVRRNWDTAGVAWENGEVNLARHVKARLYIGDTKQGFAESKSILTRPKPVVLVHGWKSSAQNAWGSAHEIFKGLHPNIGSFAVGDGQFGAEGGTLDIGDLSDSSKPTKTLAENAQELATYVENVRERTGAWHVDVIAHSMGGLISRQMIQQEMPSSPDHRPVVNRMLQMGTPNRGTPCADMVVLSSVLTNTSIPHSPATQQNTTRFVRDEFNDRFMNLKGVAPSNLAGMGRPLPCVAPPEHTLVMVTDSSGALGTAGVPYVIEEAAANTAPVLDVGGDVELSAGEKLQRVVTFTDPGSSSWSARVDYGDGAGPRPVIPDEARQITLEYQGAWGKVSQNLPTLPGPATT